MNWLGGSLSREFLSTVRHGLLSVAKAFTGCGCGSPGIAAPRGPEPGPAHRNLTEYSPRREDTGSSAGGCFHPQLDEHGPMDGHLGTAGAQRMNAGLVCEQDARERRRSESR